MIKNGGFSTGLTGSYFITHLYLPFIRRNSFLIHGLQFLGIFAVLVQRRPFVVLVNISYISFKIQVAFFIHGTFEPQDRTAAVSDRSFVSQFSVRKCIFIKIRLEPGHHILVAPSGQGKSRVFHLKDPVFASLIPLRRHISVGNQSFYQTHYHKDQ